MMKSIIKTAVLGAVLAAGWTGVALAQGGTNGPAHGIAMHGTPKYAAGFIHFDYVNPDAPKGGAVVQFGGATFDSLNQFIVNGDQATGLGLIYDTLTVAAADEAFTRYCLLCETIEVPEDRSWVEFVIREDARWHDGLPVTVEDVIFSYDILTTAGHPFYQFYYGDVAAVEKTGERAVRFSFSDVTNLELPLIVSELTILPKHYWDGRAFDDSTLEPPLGSGAYRIANVDAGSSITYERVEDYWGAALPVNVGQGNFGSIRYEFFRDPQVAREAFKGGDIDFWVENQSKAWATAFDTPAVENGLILTEEAKHNRSAGMQGYVINTRQPKFQDPRVRQALSYAFNFEWTNKELFYGAYTRTDSYFENSELASSGLLADAGDEEREILESYRGQLPEELYTEVFSVPFSGADEDSDRGNIALGSDLLTAAGWVVQDGVRVNEETGEPLAVEILLVSQQFERIVNPFVENLKRMGIDASARLVDVAQYTRRIEEFDFDTMITTFGQSLSPGNEQRNYWGSETRDLNGSRNLGGISDPVIDELIELVISAPSRESLVQRTRALDRALLWGHYVVPNWHVPHDRIAYWDKFGKPGIYPARGVQFGAWWIEEAKVTSLEGRRADAGGDGATTVAENGGTQDAQDGAVAEEPAATQEVEEVAENGDAADAGNDQAEDSGLNMAWIAGGVVVLIGLMLMIRRRKSS